MRGEVFWVIVAFQGNDDETENGRDEAYFGEGREHLELLDEIDQRFHDFSDLDSRLHRFISSAAPNRFIDSFYEIITVIFHYHYQWNKHDERMRNEVAIGEHLTYIDALLSRNIAMVELACRAHLASARNTLLRSTSRQE